MKIEVNCDLCNSKENIKIYDTKDILLNIDNEVFTLVRCTSCKHVYLSPRPDSEDLMKYYPKNYIPYKPKKTNSLFISRIKKIRRNIYNFFSFTSEHDNSTKTVLDFGCGSGENILSLNRKYPFWNIYGFDASEYATEQARSRGIKIYSPDEQPNLKFDLVILNSVIEHVDSPSQTIQNLSKRIKKGGSVRIKTPNFNSFARMLFRNKWHALDSPRHLHLFTIESLENLLGKNNFNIDKITFKRGSTVEVKSICNLFRIKKRRIWMLFGKILDPLMYLIGKAGFASTIIVSATKIK